MKKILQNRKGTSLVELLAVIVIMGIIAAIAIPTVGNLVADTQRKADIESAVAVYNGAATHLRANKGLNSVVKITAQEAKDQNYVETDPMFYATKEASGDSKANVIFYYDGAKVAIFVGAAPTATATSGATLFWNDTELALTGTATITTDEGYVLTCYTKIEDPTVVSTTAGA